MLQGGKQYCLAMLPRVLAQALVFLLVANATSHCLLVSGAYAAVCCSGNEIDHQVTKDCCTAVANGQKGWKAAQQHFVERKHNCIANDEAAGNSVNDGDVAAMLHNTRLYQYVRTWWTPSH